MLISAECSHESGWTFDKNIQEKVPIVDSLCNEVHNINRTRIRKTVLMLCISCWLYKCSNPFYNVYLYGVESLSRLPQREALLNRVNSSVSIWGDPVAFASDILTNHRHHSRQYSGWAYNNTTTTISDTTNCPTNITTAGLVEKSSAKSPQQGALTMINAQSVLLLRSLCWPTEKEDPVLTFHQIHHVCLTWPWQRSWIKSQLNVSARGK